MFRKQIHLALLNCLSLAVVCALQATSLNYVTAQPQRERRVVASEPAPTPTPNDVPAISRAIALPNSPRTLTELQSQIEQIARQPALESGFFAVKIVSLDTGQVVYQQNANKFVRPASNMKLYTVAAAFDRLTPDYHFITTVYAKEKPDQGTIKGD